MKKKYKNIIGGSILIFTVGVIGNILLIKNKHNFDESKDIEKNAIRETYKETNALDNKDAAFMLVDHYLYTSKGIRIKRLEDGSDYSIGGGIFQHEDRSYSSLISEITKYEDGKFIDINPTSSEYKQILALRNSLAKALLNGNVLSNQTNTEIMEFGKYLEKKKYKRKHSFTLRCLFNGF